MFIDNIHHEIHKLLVTLVNIELGGISQILVFEFGSFPPHHIPVGTRPQHERDYCSVLDVTLVTPYSKMEFKLLVYTLFQNGR